MVTSKASISILKNELLMTKKQLNDARSTHVFLKKEKLKAEHERNMADIQVK